MIAFRLIKNFRESEDGVVTVDWVVLAAAVVGLGIATLAVVRGGVEDLARDISSQLESVNIDTTIK